VAVPQDQSGRERDPSHQEYGDVLRRFAGDRANDGEQDIRAALGRNGPQCCTRTTLEAQ